MTALTVGLFPPRPSFLFPHPLSDLHFLGLFIPFLGPVLRTARRLVFRRLKRLRFHGGSNRSRFRWRSGTTQGHQPLCSFCRTLDALRLLPGNEMDETWNFFSCNGVKQRLLTPRPSFRLRLQIVIAQPCHIWDRGAS